MKMRLIQGSNHFPGHREGNRGTPTQQLSQGNKACVRLTSDMCLEGGDLFASSVLASQSRSKVRAAAPLFLPKWTISYETLGALRKKKGWRLEQPGKSGRLACQHQRIVLATAKSPHNYTIIRTHGMMNLHIACAMQSVVNECNRARRPRASGPSQVLLMRRLTVVTYGTQGFCCSPSANPKQ